MTWPARSPDFVDPISWRDWLSIADTAIPAFGLIGIFHILINDHFDREMALVAEFMEKVDKANAPVEGLQERRLSWGIMVTCIAACLAMVSFIMNLGLTNWRICKSLHIPRVFTGLFLGASVLFFSLGPVGMVDVVADFYPASLLNRLFNLASSADSEFILDLAFPLFWINLACVVVIFCTYVYQKYFRRPKSVEMENPASGG